MVFNNELARRCAATNTLLAHEIDRELDRLVRNLESEIEVSCKLDAALLQKDSAMGELFKRLDKAGVDYSDLIS